MDENFEIAPESTHEENETSTAATVKFGEKSRSASNLIFFAKKLSSKGTTEPEINFRSADVHPECLKPN